MASLQEGLDVSNLGFFWWDFKIDFLELNGAVFRPNNFSI